MTGIKKSGWTVPWVHAKEWDEMVHSVRHLCGKLGSNRQEAMQLVLHITRNYNDLEEPLDILCKKTCPECKDVCCLRATVWYDSRDLIYYCLAENSFPPQQIVRDESGVCCHLGPDGCRLSRRCRPFICTWYLCAQQLVLVKQLTGLPESDVQKTVVRLKQLRKTLWSVCKAGE